jgi:hypothetical protein
MGTSRGIPFWDRLLLEQDAVMVGTCGHFVPVGYMQLTGYKESRRPVVHIVNNGFIPILSTAVKVGGATMARSFDDEVGPGT